ncbi:MAG: exodeoxyribonuclease V subunit gamma [Anaerolineaceae bacterium]|nr:exodeoxyribonuclease V subunit gamma [Anaerolineaceae bacterium]
MTIELIIAPPAAGKTTACIQRIQTVQKENPLARVWVIVPDRQKAPYLRQRLAQAGGGMGVSIGTFRDLYVDILESNGIFTPVVTPALDNRLVQETLDAVLTAGEVDHYATIAHKPGFILVLQDAFAELRGAYVTPEVFLEYTRNSSPARHELAVLYDRYLTRLKKLNWIDTEGQSWLAVDVLEHNTQAVKGIVHVVVDGFTSFSGVRREFLRLLSTQVEGMTITLPGEQESSRMVNRKSNMVIKELKDSFPLQEQYLALTPHLPEFLQHMGKHILETGNLEMMKTYQPIMLEVSSQVEEAREVLRWIKALHLREGVALSDCAVFVSNLETYQPLIRTAANEFGVRVHFSHPQPIMDSPAVKSLLALLALPGEDYKTRSVMNILHSPYFDFGLDAVMVENLEKVSQQAIIVMGREQWDDAWKMLEEMNLEELDYLDEDRHKENLLKGVDLKTLRKAFEGFWHFFDGIDASQPQKQWIAWLEERMAGLRYVERLSGDWDWEAYQSLGDVLKALVMGESVAGVREVNYAQFLNDLEGTLSGASIQEPRETRQNAVLVGGIVEARAFRFKAVALLGLSEGLFPVVENPDPFLDEAMRRDLKMEPRLGREQSSIFHQAFTRAEEHLLLTRPYLAEDGEKWDPSPYWNSVKSLFTEDSCKKIQPTSPRPQADACSSEELLFWAEQQNGLFIESDALLKRRRRIAQGGKILKARRARQASGAYEGYADQLVDFLLTRYSPDRTWSPSRLEGYTTCPFDFYVNHVLGLKERSVPELGLSVAQRGSIYHEILELVYRNAGKNADVNTLLSFLQDSSASVYLLSPRKQGFRESPLWEVEKKEMNGKLRDTITALEEKRGDWDPVQLEAKFGITQPFAIDIGTEKVLIRGTIDRVDKNSGGDIRVIDYKSGSGNLSKSDLISGRRLQITIYALAAQQALSFGNVVDGFYWVIGGKQNPFLQLSKVKHESLEGLDAAYEVLQAHLEQIVHGVRAGKFPPKPPKAGCPSYCPAAGWCWRYQPSFKAG